MSGPTKRRCVSVLAVVLAVGLTAVTPAAAVGLDSSDSSGTNSSITRSDAVTLSTGGERASGGNDTNASNESESSGTTGSDTPEETGDTTPTGSSESPPDEGTGPGERSTGVGDDSTGAGSLPVGVASPSVGVASPTVGADTPTAGGGDPAIHPVDPMTETGARYTDRTGADGQSTGGLQHESERHIDIEGSTDTATGGVEDTAVILPGSNLVLSTLVTVFVDDWHTRAQTPGTLSAVSAGKVSTGVFLGAGPILGGGVRLPGPVQLAVGFGGMLVTATVPAVRSGVTAGGLANVAGNVATLLVALTPGLAQSGGHRTPFRRFVRMVSPLRYSRHDDSDPLDHETRTRVFETIEATPGAYLSEVAHRADLPLSTTRHHVRVLEREDLLGAAKVRGKRRFYPANTTGIELAAALNDDATAALLDVVARLGAASVSTLADELGLDPSTVSHHLQRLEQDDIIVRERDGRTVMNRLGPEARSALEADGAGGKSLAPEATAGGAD